MGHQSNNVHPWSGGGAHHFKGLMLNQRHYQSHGPLHLFLVLRRSFDQHKRELYQKRSDGHKRNLFNLLSVIQTSTKGFAFTNLIILVNLKILSEHHQDSRSTVVLTLVECPFYLNKIRANTWWVDLCVFELWIQGIFQYGECFALWPFICPVFPWS